MPLVVLLTGAVTAAGLEYSLPSQSRQLLLLMALVATMTGGGLVATTRAAWGWWK